MHIELDSGVRHFIASASCRTVDQVSAEVIKGYVYFSTAPSDNTFLTSCDLTGLCEMCLVLNPTGCLKGNLFLRSPLGIP